LFFFIWVRGGGGEEELNLTTASKPDPLKIIQYSLLYIYINIYMCLDPKNKAVEPMLVRLHGQVQARIDAMSSTKSKVEQMSQIGGQPNHKDLIYFHCIHVLP
jgi:hypothetical protein